MVKILGLRFTINRSLPPKKNSINFRGLKLDKITNMLWFFHNIFHS